MTVRYWVFHEQQLAAALATREAERQKEGASEQQAKDETMIVLQFLASDPGAKLRGARADG